VLAASWQLGTEWRRAPRLQLGLAMADEARSPLDDSATLGTNGTVAFRKKAFVTRRWGLEVGGLALSVVHACMRPLCQHVPPLSV
jgi:hypothetical protein